MSEDHWIIDEYVAGLEVDQPGLRKSQYVAAARWIFDEFGTEASPEVIRKFIATTPDALQPEMQAPPKTQEKSRGGRAEVRPTHGGGNPGNFEKRAREALDRFYGVGVPPARSIRPEFQGKTAMQLLELHYELQAKKDGNSK